MRRRTHARFAVTYGGALLLAIFLFGPFVMVAAASLQADTDLRSFPPTWFEHGVFLDNYEYILTGEIPQSFLQEGAKRGFISKEIRYVLPSLVNSFQVAFAVMLINLAFGSLAAYAYARLRFPARGVTLNFVLFSRLIPTVAIAVPYYAIIQRLNLLDNHVGLIAIYSVLTLPFTLLVLTLYFKNIPLEVDEAAQVEGASPLQILWHIVLPLSLPSLVGAGLFAFMLAYGEFLFALLMITSFEKWTLPAIFGITAVNPDAAWSFVTAAIIVGSLPTFLLAFPVWRFMVRGLTAGAER